MLSRIRGEAEWLRDLRCTWLERYLRQGLPGSWEEEWRGTNLRGMGLEHLPLSFPESSAAARQVRLFGSDACGIGGRLNAVFARLNEQARRRQVLLWSYLMRSYPEARTPALVAMNGAMMTNGVLFCLPAGSKTPEVNRAVFRAGPGQKAFFPHNVVALGEESEALFIEEYASAKGRGPRFCNGVTEVFVGRGARLEILTQLQWDDDVSACHRAVAHVADGGELIWYVGTAGGDYVRVDVDVFLDGPGAKSHIVGVGLGKGGRFLDHRTVQHHVRGDTKSRIHFGTLLAEESRSIYRGLIRMDEGAVRSDAYQKNDNLMLEPGPRAQAIPMLEILTDDVKCSHGSTVGRLRDEDIFYLTSRGIPYDRARALIADGFIRRQLASAGPWGPLAERLHGMLSEAVGGPLVMALEEE